MKKLLTIAATLLLAIECFATGPLVINSPQSGTSTFTNGGSASNTITFNPGFTYPPVVSLFLLSSPTNALPLTNAVTTTNMTIIESTTVVGSTNATIAWTAMAGYPRVQFGTNITLAAVSTNISFVTPYAQVPTVEIQELTTNATMSVTAVTTTNFTVIANVAAGFLWFSFGVAGSPGPFPVTY